MCGTMARKYARDEISVNSNLQLCRGVFLAAEVDQATGKRSNNIIEALARAP
jgi:hypothetical protein